MNEQTNVGSLSEMPTSRAMVLGLWKRSVAYIVLAFLLFGFLPYALYKMGGGGEVFQGPAIMYGMIMIGVSAILAALSSAVADDERGKLRRGTATRSTLDYLAKQPALLLFLKDRDQLWKEAQERVMKEEEKQQREARVKALIDAVPADARDLRREALRRMLRRVDYALGRFDDDQQVLDEVGHEAFLGVYRRLVCAIAGELAEKVGIAVQSTPGKVDVVVAADLAQFMSESGVVIADMEYFEASDSISDGVSRLRRAISWGCAGTNPTFLRGDHDW